MIVRSLWALMLTIPCRLDVISHIYPPWLAKPNTVGYTSYYIKATRGFRDSRALRVLMPPSLRQTRPGSSQFVVNIGTKQLRANIGYLAPRKIAEYHKSLLPSMLRYVKDRHHKDRVSVNGWIGFFTRKLDSATHRESFSFELYNERGRLHFIVSFPPDLASVRMAKLVSSAIVWTCLAEK